MIGIQKILKCIAIQDQNKIQTPSMCSAQRSCVELGGTYSMKQVLVSKPWSSQAGKTEEMTVFIEGIL